MWRKFLKSVHLYFAFAIGPIPNLAIQPLRITYHTALYWLLAASVHVYCMVKYVNLICRATHNDLLRLIL